MNPRALLVELWGLLTRFFPWPAPTGLEPIGAPGPAAPVLLSGNYRVALQRLRRALRGHDAWLLVVDSRGINVWCAAAGGHLTTHEVIAALRSSGVDERVTHRELVLPQLCATGVEPRVIEQRTGWRARFGPVRVGDLPAFLARGKTTRTMRCVYFGLLERLEMGAMWGLPVAALCLAAGGLITGIGAGLLCAGSTLVTALLLFVSLPALPARGNARFSTGLGAAALFFALTAGAWSLTSGLSLGTTAVLGALGLALGMLFVADLAGSTPTMSSDTHHAERLRVEVLRERCTACAECVLICPREVLAIQDEVVELAQPADCIRCGACLVQCPEDALRFQHDDGGVIDAATVRRTKLNLLGRRAVRVRTDDIV